MNTDTCSKPWSWLLFWAFFALSLNMRAPITSLPPVIRDIQNAFGISTGLAGMLTSIPVFCFGFLTPFVGALMKKVSLETSVFFTLAGVLAGSLIRSWGGFGAAFAGTVIIGIALTSGNIVTLMVIGRDFARYASVMTGILVCGMSIGSMGTMGLTAPLAHALGWRWALALPIVLALFGIALWAWAGRAARLREAAPAVPQPRRETGEQAKDVPVTKLPIAWLLAAAFAAHTFMFYGLTAWLPAYLSQSVGMSVATAGGAASLFQILGLIGCFGLPFMDTRLGCSKKVQFLTVTLTWVATTAGFLAAPEYWVLWCIFGGVASGGGFTVVFGQIMAYARDLDQNRRISSMVQSVGYMIASLSPFVMGYLHTLTSGWTVGMVILIGAGGVMTLCGLAVCRQ